MLLRAALALAVASADVTGHAQVIETGRDRVVTNLKVSLPPLGTVRGRSVSEIAGSNWLLGCETLDRDFADYEQYKAYLAPLGIARVRLQGGWSRTESVRGRYDFGWLDRIVDDASRRGLRPWIQTGYGNPLYPGGGGNNLGAGLPVSAEALQAYDRWVTALVTRYRDRVRDWEVWNEPNFGDNTLNSPEMTADFNVRTARIIKALQPDALISGLALGHFDARFVDRFLTRVAEHRAFDLFDTFTYHDYAYNPDANALEVAALKAALATHTTKVRWRQGENGAPSVGGSGGALWDYPWSELTQAKWNTRRMLADLGHDIESSVFSIVEMHYTSGPISRMNRKGLLKSDASKRVIRPKIAWYAVQNVAAVFDDSLERLRDLAHTYNLAGSDPASHAYTHTTDRKLAVYGYRHKVTGRQVYAIWQRDNIPAEANDISLQEFSVSNGDFEQPVWVDMITGAVHEIPAAQWRRNGRTYTFTGIPVYDAPVLVADRSLVPLAP